MLIITKNVMKNIILLGKGSPHISLSLRLQPTCKFSFSDGYLTSIHPRQDAKYRELSFFLDLQNKICMVFMKRNSKKEEVI
jgi:hypothetical protein